MLLKIHDLKVTLLSVHHIETMLPTEAKERDQNYDHPHKQNGFLASVIAQTILMTWVYNNTGGSLLLAALFHFGSDAFLTFFPPAWVSPSGVALTFALMTVLQAAVVETARAGLP